MSGIFIPLPKLKGVPQRYIDILKYIQTHHNCSPIDIVKDVGYRYSQVKGALTSMLKRGWVKRSRGAYSITVEGVRVRDYWVLYVEPKGEGK